jgi:D-alanyl-lipoteichoic acid acyltransferase DltB (MBOAT superfamily)
MRRFPFGAAEPYFGVFAYFVTFFLVGAWHGQTTMFMFFGVLQGGGTAANKLYQILLTRRLTRKGYRALAANRLYADISRGLNFTWFAFTLLWFWSSWSQLGALLTEAGPWAAVAGWAVVLATSTVVLSICAALHRRFVRASSPEAAALSPSRYWRTIAGTAMVVIIVAFTVILNGPAPDVVYKNF